MTEERIFSIDLDSCKVINKNDSINVENVRTGCKRVLGPHFDIEIKVFVIATTNPFS